MTTKEWRVYGVVQGVGFRPFVHRLAEAHGLAGYVANKGSYVEIVAAGKDDSLAAFRRELVEKAPARALILRVDAREIEPFPCEGFSITKSEADGGSRFVSPDIAICSACRKELFDKNDRRYLHPFINCTDCGPRLTILDEMPYDRERTSMKHFPMCADCASEYHDKNSRRYDAQPIACHDCGPQVYLLDGSLRGAEAIRAARRSICEGKIVAVKGIGGFHLCCDASKEAAVKLLRERKRRPTKPFAVMARDFETAAREAEIPASMKNVLDGPEKPIVILRRRSGGRIASAAAPGSRRVGIMLPYTPLHLMLFDYPDGLSVPDVLLMTSGNPPGAPICRTDDEARETLAPLADVILSHDRRIRVRADDSVMEVYDGEPYMIRRSRGYAPLPVFLPPLERMREGVLAVGSELKNTFCLGQNGMFYPSAHTGDMGDPRSVGCLQETTARMASLLEIAPRAVAYDPHPAYHTAGCAASLGLPMVAVQHHHAHIVSCMAENGREEPVIGVTFDGTGYGTDGSVWGGEILLAGFRDFTRLGSIEPFPQAGGERAAREGWRIATGLLRGGDARETALRLGLGNEEEIAAQSFLIENNINTVTSTSAGRLFDAVSAALGICRVSTFEGEAAMRLQYAAEAWEAEGEVFDLPTSDTAEDGRTLLPTTSLFAEIVRRRLAGANASALAAAFHASLAAQIGRACRAARERTGVSTAALSGGVFQNTLLLRLVERDLREGGFETLRHRLVPANDGGLSLGQAVCAAARMVEKK